MPKPKKNTKNATRKKKKRKNFWSSLCCGQVEKEENPHSLDEETLDEDEEPCAYIVEKLAVKRVPLRAFEGDNSVENTAISENYKRLGQIERITKVRDVHATAVCKSISSTTSTTDLISNKDFKTTEDTELSSYYLTDGGVDKTKVTPKLKSRKSKRLHPAPSLSPPRNIYMFQSEAPFAMSRPNQNQQLPSTLESIPSQNNSRSRRRRTPTDMHEILLDLGYKQPNRGANSNINNNSSSNDQYTGRMYHDSHLEQVNQITYTNGYNSPRFYNAEKPYANKVEKGPTNRNLTVCHMYEGNSPVRMFDTKTLTHTVAKPTHEHVETQKSNNIRNQYKKRMDRRANFTTSTHTYYYYNKNDQNTNVNNAATTKKKHEMTQMTTSTSSSSDDKHCYTYRHENPPGNQSDECFKYEEDVRQKGEPIRERTIPEEPESYMEKKVVPDKNGAVIFREPKMHVDASAAPCTKHITWEKQQKTKLRVSPHVINKNTLAQYSNIQPRVVRKFIDKGTRTSSHLFKDSFQDKPTDNENSSEKNIWRIFIKEQELKGSQRNKKSNGVQVPRNIFNDY